jgi:F-type H+-transporting ATPase subunit b
MNPLLLLAQEATEAPDKVDYFFWMFDLAFWSVVVFALLALVLGRFAFAPLAAAMRKREQMMRDAVRRAELAREESERLLQLQDEELTKIHVEARAVVREARRDAEVIHKELVDKAAVEAKHIHERLQRDVRLATQRAKHDLWTTAGDLITSIAERILSRELTDDDHRQMISAAMEEIGSAAEARR